ncbi:MAG: hypothetical protein M3Q07_02860 [Pseudobdellovibrionaceae bacterium]|nr:hypothetical protein [Pseudobdellovibrionaceae bacterium]
MNRYIMYMAFVTLAVSLPSKAQNLELKKTPNLFPEAYLGVYNSSLGAGFGLSSDVLDRFTAGIRWFGGSRSDTETYGKDNRSKRIYFENSETFSQQVSIFGRYRVLETLSVTGAIDRKWSESRIAIHDKENFFRRGDVAGDSTVSSLYVGVGNYWSENWYRAGVDWIGISIPFASQANASYNYFEPTDQMFEFEGDTNPGLYYRNVDSLMENAKSNLTMVGATLLLANVGIHF